MFYYNSGSNVIFIPFRGIIFLSGKFRHGIVTNLWTSDELAFPSKEDYFYGDDEDL